MALTAEKLVIEVSLKDAKKAKKALKDLETTFKETGKKGKDSFDKLRQSTKGLRRDLGALRNNLLVVTFALAGVRAAFKGFFEARASMQKFEAQLRAFSGSAEIATQQMSNFIDMAAKTPFNIEAIVQGGVQLEAFGAKAEPLMMTMGNLAAMMNKTIPEASAAFGRAFAGGRGAADVFREMGILQIIDSFQSLDETLNQESLTLDQFKIKMIEALTDPEGKVARGMDELEGTLFQSFANMSDAIFMFKDRVGGELEPVFMGFAKVVTKLFEAISVNVIRDFGAVLKVVMIAVAVKATVSIGALGVSLATTTTLTGFFTASIARATIAMGLFNKMTMANKLVLFATVIAAAVEGIKRFKARTEESDESLKKAAMTIEQYIVELKKISQEKALEEQAKQAAENIIKLETQLNVLQATTAVQKAQAASVRILTADEIKLIQQIEKKKVAIKNVLDLEKQRAKFVLQLRKMELDSQLLIDAHWVSQHEFQEADFKGFIMNEERKRAIKKEFLEKNITLEELKIAKKEAEDKVSLLKESEQAAALEVISSKFNDAKEELERKHQGNMAKIKEDFAASDKDIADQKLEDIRSFNLFVEDSYMESFNKIQTGFSTLIKNNMDSELKALKKTDKFRNASAEERENMENDLKNKFAGQQRASFMAQQMAQIAQVFMTLNRAIFEINAAAATAKAAGDLTAESRAAKLITGLRISSGIQSGLIAGQKPPAFARGGSFITNGPQQIIVGDNPGGAERVDVSPLSSPNFDGPAGSEITVNIVGNVIGTEEFVRDTLLPELDNSIRRNLA